MGGFGSGRHSGWPTVEQGLTLDLARLIRKGWVRDGVMGSGSLDWSRNGRRGASVGYSFDLTDSDDARVTLRYTWTPSGGEPRTVEQLIRLTWTRPHYGGRRWWFICPFTGRSAWWSGLAGAQFCEGKGAKMEQAVKAVLAAFGLVYLATAIAAPGWFLDRLSLNERDRRKGAARWLLWPTFLFTTGGVCLLVYQAFDPLFAWIPRDWGTIEDGEFFAHRDLWRMALSFILGVLLVSKVELNAETLIQGPVDKRARLVLTGAIQEAARSVPGLLKTTGMYVAEGLERSDLELPSAADDRKDATRKEILHDLRDWPQIGPIEK